jgi:two-component system, cell cycle sensor histidine kinase and response regulator CckA
MVRRTEGAPRRSGNWSPGTEWIDRLPAPAAILRRNGELTKWNAAAVELLGWAHAFPMRLGGPGVPWFERLLEALRREGQHRTVITRRRDGRRIVVELRCSILDGDEILVLFAECPPRPQPRSGRATAERKLQQQLQRSEEQLRHAQKMDSVGRLAAGVAHDFNNVLTAIQGHLQFLLEDLPEEGTARADALEIQRAADRAADLSRQLLSFARKQPRVPQELNLNVLVLGLEKLLRRLMRGGMRLETVLQPDLPAVWADAGQLEQVIVNLVINARDALVEGEGSIVVRTARIQLTEPYRDRGLMLHAGTYVVVSVTDNGCGMSPGMQQRAFEPFFTTKDQGTGLGLATADGIIRQAGGCISVYSEENLGTTFKLFLPALADGAHELQGAESVTERERPDPGRTVLVAEDEAAIREFVCRALRRTGFRVIEASNGEDALRAAEAAETIDLVVTDLIMPGLRGDELARRLEQCHPAAGMVLISGFADASRLVTSDIPLRTEFLDKPFAPRALLEAARKALRT